MILLCILLVMCHINCMHLQVAEAIGMTCPWASHFRVTSARASAAAVERSAARMSLLYSVTHSSHAARVLLNSTAAAAAVNISGGCCDGTACCSSERQQQQQCASTSADESAKTAPLDSVSSSANSSSDALESSIVILPTADASHSNSNSSSSSEDCPERLVPEPINTSNSSYNSDDAFPSGDSSRHVTNAVSSDSALKQQQRTGLSTSSSTNSGSTSSMWMNFGLWRRRPCGGIPTYTQVCSLLTIVCIAILLTITCCRTASTTHTVAVIAFAL
jgi:hypothetical protein